MTLPKAIKSILSTTQQPLTVRELTDLAYARMKREKPESAVMCVRAALSRMRVNDILFADSMVLQEARGPKRKTVNAPTPVMPPIPAIDFEAIIQAATVGFETGSEKLVAELSARRAVALIRKAQKRQRSIGKAVSAC